MTRLARIVAFVVLMLGNSEIPTCAQSNVQSFVTYQCQHKSCEEIARLLRPLLPQTADESIQLVVDREQNRLLVSGPASVHRMTQKLIQEVDNQLAFREVRPVPTKVMDSYRLPAAFHEHFQRDLDSRFGKAVRVSADEGAETVFVIANADTHRQIRAIADAYAAQVVRAPDPESASLPREQRSPPATANHARFVRVPQELLDRVQQQLMAIFNTRLGIRSVGQRQIFLLDTTGKAPRQLEIEFDRARSGVLVGGDGTAADQMVTLIELLSRRDESGRRSKVFRLRRDNHERLRTVIESGAAWGRQPPIELTLRQAAPKIHRLPTVGSNSRSSGVEWVRYLFQEDEVADGSEEGGANNVQQIPAAAADGPAPIRQFEGVEIESLPELDVIIMRGPDSALDQLADVIQQLERISRETQPEIRIYPLQYAQSEAISEIVQEVSSDLVGGRQGRVSVFPLVKPNSILLIGWGDAVQAVENLLRQLDQPVTPESQSAVFRLKHASAAQVQQTLQTFLSNRAGLGPRVQLAIDARTNSIIAYAAPRDMDEIRRLIDEIDRPEGKAVNRARVFQIENALAADVAATLQQAIQAAAGDGDRSASLELQTFDANGQSILRSGTLQDVQITPNPRNNTLIVSSPLENLELIEELINQLDTPASQAKIKVFRIVNGDAASLVDTLRSLIPSQGSGASVGSQLSASGEAGLAPLRFSVDTRSNSIIATGSEGDLRIVEALLAKLDQSNVLQRKTAVYRLKNSPAIDVASAVNQYLFSRRQLESAAPGEGNPFAEIEREVVVVPEPVGNKLILAATPRYFPEVERLIEKLDEAPPQVLIQVLIAEVELDDADEFGVELGLQDSVLFDRSLLGDLITTSSTTSTQTVNGIVTTTEDIIQAADNIPGFAFNNLLPLGNSGSSAALAGARNVGGQGISNFDVGRSNDQLGFGGLVLSASSKNLSVLLRALRESRRVDVLSRPQIRTLDNQPAYIQVGQRVPRIVGSTVNQNGQSNTVDLENVGLILGVTPRVSPDGTVVMEIDAEKSKLGSEQEGIPVAVSIDGTVVRSPRVDTATAQATVSAADGETIVLGGLITKSDQYVHRSVPFLGNIPIIEHLFRFDSNITQRTELLIILTPHVIRTPEDNEKIRQAEMAQMSWCVRDVFNLVGDMNYTPEPQLNSVEVGEPEVVYPDLNPLGTVPQAEPPLPLSGSSQLDVAPSVLLDGPANGSSGVPE